MLPGHRLGPYEIASLIGVGGMGEVYLAEDTRLGRRVALKRTPAAFASPEAHARLEREARAAARLNHPGIAAVYDVLDLDGTLNIVMEYVEGETLAAHLRAGPLKIERATDIGTQLADALAAAHAADVIHRDLKPSNVAITPGGRAKILDFGIARVGAGRGAETHGPIFGTPGYSAPEQLLGAPGDARSDIYSLGAVLYELLTGRPPLDPTSDPIAAQIAALAERPRDLREVNPAVPEAMSALVMRALAREPSHRVPSADMFRAELERVAVRLRERPTVEIEPKPRRFFDVLPGSGWIALVLATAITAGVAISLLPNWRPPESSTAVANARPVMAILPLKNLTGNTARDYIGSGIADSLRIELARLPGVTILSRAVMREYDVDADPRRLASQLAATFILDGTVQAAGNRLRLNISLLRDDASIVWTKGYESDSETDLFDIQRRIAQEVASDGLRLRLSVNDLQRLGAPRTSSVAALDAYWRGQDQLERADEPRGTAEAIESLDQAVAADPEFALAHAALADAYWMRYQQTRESTDAERAIAAAERALQLDPRQPQVWIALARNHHGTGRLDDAEKDLQRALGIESANDEARRLLGVVYTDQGRNADAEREYRAAIDLRPRYWKSYADLGAFYYRAARYRDAVSAFLHAAELNPRSARIFHNLGSAYHQLGDTTRALENYLKAVSIAPMATTYSNMGTIQFEAGQYEEAAASFRFALLLAPANPLHFGNLGDALRKLDRPAEAAEAYASAVEASQQSLKVNPNDARTLMRLAVYEAKLGRPDAAERDASRAVAVNPQDPEAIYRKAQVLAINGKTSQALSALGEALTKGYSVAQAEKDEDLAVLRDLPAFRALVRQHQPSGGDRR
jgi:eukaryotic-like serine/threonine-protein kinase